MRSGSLRTVQPEGSETLLECDNLSFAYEGREMLLQNVSFTIQPGDFIHLHGPSGSGKSTLLRLLNRLEEPTSGEIRFRGKPLESYPPPELRRAIGYIQQTPTLVEGDVRKNLLLPFSFKVNRHLVVPGSDELESMLGEFLLTGVRLSDPAQTLSGGQRQRLCILRSILLSPELLLLDEPVSALDADSREAVERTVEHLNLERGLALVLVSHQGFSTQRARPEVFTLSNGVLFQGESGGSIRKAGYGPVREVDSGIVLEDVKGSL
jgi:putative ABC transport system ATP-binding protein